MKNRIGKLVMQQEGYKAFIPNPFPAKMITEISPDIHMKSAEANRLIGKLDGITQTLPDVEFFLKMFVTKDATSSSQIEGTQATMVDAIELAAGLNDDESDANDILFYIKALEYGLKKLDTLPLSQRVICEIHSELMSGARASQFSDPGNIRKSQNWLGGASPNNALFVPPPPHALGKCMSDLEKFMHNNEVVPEIIQAALIHAQFETIHPFLDGNGRTGRLLVTLFLHSRSILERPVLFFSSQFIKHRKTYYEKLNGYHNGEIEEWIRFFLDCVIATAQESIDISKKIRSLRDEDMSRLLSLGQREAASGVKILTHLFAEPIVTSNSIMELTDFSRPGSLKLLDRFVQLGILELRSDPDSRKKAYGYNKYLALFS